MNFEALQKFYKSDVKRKDNFLKLFLDDQLRDNLVSYFSNALVEENAVRNEKMPETILKSLDEMSKNQFHEMFDLLQIAAEGCRDGEITYPDFCEFALAEHNSRFEKIKIKGLKIIRQHFGR